MAYSYYYIQTHPVMRTKKLFTLEQAQEYHKQLWVWKSENPTRMIEQWPGFESQGGDCPIGFMYKFVCDLTKDRLGVRRCSECPYKWIDRETNKALGRWSPWHWCDYPGALLNKYHKAIEDGDFEKAKQVALELSEMKLSYSYAASAIQKLDRPSYDELVEKVASLESATDPDRINKIATDVEKIKPRVDILDTATDQLASLREAKENVSGS